MEEDDDDEEEVEAKVCADFTTFNLNIIEQAEASALHEACAEMVQWITLVRLSTRMLCCMRCNR